MSIRITNGSMRSQPRNIRGMDLPLEKPDPSSMERDVQQPSLVSYSPLPTSRKIFLPISNDAPRHMLPLSRAPTLKKNEELSGRASYIRNNTVAVSLSTGSHGFLESSIGLISRTANTKEASTKPPTILVTGSHAICTFQPSIVTAASKVLKVETSADKVCPNSSQQLRVCGSPNAKSISPVKISVANGLQPMRLISPASTHLFQISSDNRSRSDMRNKQVQVAQNGHGNPAKPYVILHSPGGAPRQPPSYSGRAPALLTSPPAITRLRGERDDAKPMQKQVSTDRGDASRVSPLFVRKDVLSSDAKLTPPSYPPSILRKRPANKDLPESGDLAKDVHVSDVTSSAETLEWDTNCPTPRKKPRRKQYLNCSTEEENGYEGDDDCNTECSTSDPRLNPVECHALAIVGGNNMSSRAFHVKSVPRPRPKLLPDIYARVFKESLSRHFNSSLESHVVAERLTYKELVSVFPHTPDATHSLRIRCVEEQMQSVRATERENQSKMQHLHMKLSGLSRRLPSETTGQKISDLLKGSLSRCNQLQSCLHSAQAELVTISSGEHQRANNIKEMVSRGVHPAATELCSTSSQTPEVSSPQSTDKSKRKQRRSPNQKSPANNNCSSKSKLILTNPR